MKSEWDKFREQLTKNPLRKDILSFINDIEWTDRQKTKMMSYMNTIDGLLARDLTDENDLRQLRSDKEVAENELYLGITRFDNNPEFNRLIDFINIYFGMESRKARFRFKR